MSKRIIGADTGGTFTDLVLPRRRRLAVGGQAASTTDDLSDGVIDGVRKLLDECRGTTADIECVVHATTVATNAIHS